MSQSEKCIQQAAALVRRDGSICLVTTRSGKRWIVPKGRVKPGSKPWQTAAEEAWEEAGVRGKPRREPVGSFVVRKSGRAYLVTVFLMEVSKVARKWPERKKRRRRWLSVEQALALLDRSPLSSIVRSAVGA